MSNPQKGVKNMASDLSFVEWVIDQASGAGVMNYKKMFGEYGIYCDGKIVGVICDNILYVKKTQAGASACPKLKEGLPYDGAKTHFVFEDVDDREMLARFIKATCEELPAPTPKKKK